MITNDNIEFIEDDSGRVYRHLIRGRSVIGSIKEVDDGVVFMPQLGHLTAEEMKTISDYMLKLEKE